MAKQLAAVAGVNSTTMSHILKDILWMC